MGLLPMGLLPYGPFPGVGTCVGRGVSQGHFFLAFRHDCPTRHLRLSALADSLSDADDDEDDDDNNDDDGDDNVEDDGDGDYYCLSDSLPQTYLISPSSYLYVSKHLE